VGEPERVRGPDAWDRYYRVNVGLNAVLGTPGVPQAAFGETVMTARAAFTQAADEGFFLLADEPLERDPAEVSAAIARLPDEGRLASLCGTRRRSTHRTATGTHQHFQTLLRGARIVGSDVRLHQDGRGVFAVTGRPLGDTADRDPGPAPLTDDREALASCRERFGVDDELVGARIDQVIFPLEHGATWAYEVSFVVPADAADARVYLRADDLSVLLSYNIASSAPGKGRVYPVNPLQTAALVDVSLDGLASPGSMLRGDALDVRPARAARLERPDGDFEVDPAEPAFDEVQAYHHLWRVRDYFGRIVDATLLAGPPFAPMIALVNDPLSPNNAYFTPSTGQLRFGTFGHTRSSARSASMVYHEFGHAVTDAICHLGRAKLANTESRGLSEGYSDYFAASLLGDPRFGDYVANIPEGARNCADPALRFPPGRAGREHDTGAVWAAVLWAIRGRLNQATTDKLAIESVEFLDSASTFDDARAALHTADTQLSGGANSAVIDEEYDARAPA
jgi:hypothetical protein